MKNKIKISWQVWLAVGLVAVAAIVYLFEYEVFHNRDTIFVWILNDIAFVPINVLLVTLFLDKLFRYREKQQRLHKMNMVIGAFFSEVGTTLLRSLSKDEIRGKELTDLLCVKPSWSEQEYLSAKNKLHTHQFDIVFNREVFEYLKQFLIDKRVFMIGLLENQTLLEQESFSDMLWATFHLAEELALRENFDTLPKPDHDHINLDAKRAYVALINQWIDYMLHLKKAYPYLYSLPVRMNPFNKDASPIITG